MEQHNLKFREIKRSDYPALRRIISDTWRYERFCSPKTAKRMAKLYLASCLAEQTFTCVAEKNGIPMGVIMGKNEKMHRTPSRYTFGRATSVLSMLITKERRRVLKMFADIDKLDKVLLAESGKTFDGELAFFAVESKGRGSGIGKELFERLIQYMKSGQISNFYLYTDTTCNYGFYEHQGMQRLCEKKISLKPYIDEEMQFFLYGYGIS